AAGIARINVHGDTATDVSPPTVVAPDDLASTGIMHLHAVLSITARAFMHHEDFKPGTTRKKIPQMQGIAVTEASGVKSAAIIIDSCRTIDNLIAAVTIDITDSKAVRTLPGIGTVTAAVAVKRPALGQLTITPVPGHYHRAGVVTPGHNQTRPGTVQIGNASEKAIDAIVVGITPAADGASCRNVTGGSHSTTCLAVKDREEFRAGKNVATGVAMIRISIANHHTGAIACTVGCLHRHFSFAITIEVVHDKLRVMRSRTDIATQVYPPQASAREFIGVNEDVAGVAGLGIVLCVRRLPFHDDFVFTVTIQVTHTQVIGDVVVGHPIRGCATVGTLQVDRQIRIAPDRTRRTVTRFAAINHRTHGVAGCGAATAVKVVGAVGNRRTV